MTFDTTYASKPCGAILIGGKFLISALAFFALSFFGTGLNAAIWTVKHLTGDEDSGVSSALTYTCAVNVHGTEDKVVNGVTFKANSGTSGEGWAITQNFQTQHNGQASTVGGVIGEVLSNRMRYNGDPQKLKLTGLTPGQSYIFSIYNQAWSEGENRTAVLSLDAADETVTVNQGEFSTMPQDGQLVQCHYIADESEVEFTVDPLTDATWHLYAFSNAVSPPLLPVSSIDKSNPLQPTVMMEWKAGVTEFTSEDILANNATVSDFQEISSTKYNTRNADPIVSSTTGYRDEISVPQLRQTPFNLSQPTSGKLSAPRTFSLQPGQ